jgi:hypothetical protein
MTGPFAGEGNTKGPVAGAGVRDRAADVSMSAPHGHPGGGRGG